MNTYRASAVFLFAFCSVFTMAAPVAWSADMAAVDAADTSQKPSAQQDAAKAEQANPFAYDFKIKGIKDAELKEELTKAAQLTSLLDVPVTSLRALERWASDDVETFQTILRGHGYFDASASYTIKKEDVYHVTITVDKGVMFTINDYKVFLTTQKNDDKARALVDDALAQGVITFPRKKQALPPIVQAPQQAILSLLMQNGYPYPYITERVLLVDHETKEVAVHISLNAGPRAFFGNTTLIGLERVDPAFIERRIAWKRGEEFDIRKVTKTQRDIARSGVIGSVRVRYGGRPAPAQEKATRIKDGASLPMRVTMQESDRRTLGAGASYSTSLGPAAHVFWEHRNVFGGAERFRADLDVGTSLYGIGATFHKPDLMDKRSLSYQSSFSLREEELEAYDRRGVFFSNGVTWQATNRLSFNGGFGMEHARIKEKDKSAEFFTLISFPLMGKYDSSDDLLNPQKGWRISAGLTPYQALNKGASFLTNDIAAAHYWPLSKKLVWANRAKLGMIYGESLDDVPADKRLYSGGGGSVRGYGFQMVGPLDKNNDPTGGRMQVEASTEMRFQVTEDIGAVGFFDAGRVSQDIGGDGELLYSAGIGVRYYTVAGPIRFDVAVPLKKRPADDNYQIYISLGQAF